MRAGRLTPSRSISVAKLCRRRCGVTCVEQPALRGLGQRRLETQHQSAPSSTATWEQEALRIGESRERRRSAQGEDPARDPPHLGIGRNQTFRV